MLQICAESGELRFECDVAPLSENTRVRIARIGRGDVDAGQSAQTMRVTESIAYPGCGIYTAKVTTHKWWMQSSTQSVFLCWKDRTKFNVSELMRKNDFDRCQNMDGVIEVDTGIVLYSLARRLPSHSVILEVGWECGRSTSFLAAGGEFYGATIVCVRSRHRTTGGTGDRLPKGRFARRSGQHRDAITLLGDQSRIDDATGDRGVSLLVLHGDESLKRCAYDFASGYPRVNDNGMIVFCTTSCSEKKDRIGTLVSYLVEGGMLEILSVAPNVIVTRKCNPVVIRTGEGTRGGAESISHFLALRGIRTFLCDYVGQSTASGLALEDIPRRSLSPVAPGGYSGHRVFIRNVFHVTDAFYLRRAAVEAADRIICHGVVGTDLDSPARSKMLIYAMQGTYWRIHDDDDLQQQIRAGNYGRVLCNSRSLEYAFKAIGIEADHCYRPMAQGLVERKFKPLPSKPILLWYVAPEHPPMVPYMESIRWAIEQLCDIEIHIVGGKARSRQVEMFGDLEHVVIRGRVCMWQAADEAYGMVRLSHPYDLGRSALEVISRGRFYAGIGIDEEFGYSADSVNELVSLVRGLLQTFDDDAARAIYDKAGFVAPEEVGRRLEAHLI